MSSQIPPEKRSFWRMEIGGRKVRDAPRPSAFERHLPSVNLLPATVIDAIAVRKVRRNYVFLTLFIIAAVLGVWLLQNGTILPAQIELAAAQSRGQVISAQLARLAPVEKLGRQIEGQETFIAGALASKVDTSRVLDALITDARPAIELSSVTIDINGIPRPETSNDRLATLNECPHSDPFSTSITIGCIAFTAIAPNRADISSFLERIEADDLFVGTYLTDSTAVTQEGRPESVSFTGTIGISPDALATPLTREQIDDIIKAATTPDPSATPTPGAP